MHVAVFSHYRLPVKGYGGTERVVVALVRALAVLGHRVTLVASPGTRVREATVIEVPPATLTDADVDLASLLPPGVDIAARLLPVEALALASVRADPRGQFARRARPCRPTTSSYREITRAATGATCSSTTASIRRISCSGPSRTTTTCSLAESTASKGYRWAIEGAKRSGRRLLLAGGWRPSFRRNIRFVGEVDRAQEIGAARGSALPLDAGAVARAVRAHHDRGAVLGHAGTRHALGRAARSREPGGRRPGATRWTS